jgi:hypothetical protein
LAIRAGCRADPDAALVDRTMAAATISFFMAGDPNGMGMGDKALRPRDL